MQGAAEIAQCLHPGIKTRVFAGLRTARPHPVGGEAHAVESVGEGRPHDVGERLGHGHHRTGLGTGETHLRGVTDSGGDTGATAIVERHHAAVGQRQLEFTLTLLVCHLTRHRTVHLVGEPVFAGHGFEAQHVAQIGFELRFVVNGGGVFALHRHVGHHRLGRVAEHLCDIEVEGALAVGLFEGEVRITRGFAHHIEGRTFALGNAAHVVDVLFLNEEAHALLTLVGDDFLGRKRRIAHGQAAHVDGAAALFDEFGQTVDVTGRTVVVDRHHGVVFLLAEGAHEVGGALLHFGVGALHGIELNTRAVTPRVDRRNRAAAETDAVVVTADHHDFVTLLGRAFEAVALRAVAHTAGEHDHFVEGVVLAIFGVLEGEHRTGDEGLAELVAEVRSTVGSLREDLAGRLVKPGASRHIVLPRTLIVQAGIGRHVDRRAGNGQRTDTTSHTVADFTARTGRSTVERLDRRGEVVRFGLDGDDTLDVANHKIVGRVVTGGRKLLHHRAFGERHVVFVGRKDTVRIFFRGAFDHRKERRGHFLAVDHERTAEDFVTAVFRIELCEAKDLTVGERAAELSLHAVEIFDLGGRKRQSFLLIVGVEIVDGANGFGRMVDGEKRFVQSVVDALQHRVVLLLGCGGEVLFDARNAVEIHVLRDLNGICAPRGDHFAAGSDEEPVHPIAFDRGSFAVEPAKFFQFFGVEAMIGRSGDNASNGGAEKENHFEQVYYVWGIEYDMRGKVTHLLSADHAPIHIFIPAFSVENSALLPESAEVSHKSAEHCRATRANAGRSVPLPRRTSPNLRQMPPSAQKRCLRFHQSPHLY